MKKLISTVVSAALVACVSMSAHAKIAGKNVVLVHGFQSEQIRDRPNNSELANDAREYWSDYWGSRAEENIYWSSAERVTGGIQSQVRSQLQAIANRGTCRNGCVFVTHSTGDLVTRHIIQRLGSWGLSSRVKVLATLDFAGAGGGTEIADVAADIAAGSGFINSVQRSAVELFLGFRPEQGQLGVLYDLRPNTARNIATSNNGVPRLRFVGTGSEYLGATKPFISGSDDSVVPLHSACGASSKGAYDSCSKSVKVNGELTSVSKAPNSLWRDHYVVLMGERTNHGQVINNSRSGDFTTVRNNFNAGGLNIDFRTTTGRKWWSWGRQVRLVRDGSSKSMSRNVFDTINN